MWSYERRAALLRLGRLGAAMTAAGLTGGCFQPLYGDRLTSGGESVRDRLGAIEIAQIPAGRGSPEERLAVALRNSLQYGLNGGAGPHAPTHRLNVSVGATFISVIVDVTSGRADALVDLIQSSYNLVEIASGAVVLNDSTFARVSYDVPGSAQRFAKQRAQRDAEDRGIEVVSENIKNRLASYFVAGT